MGNFVPKIYTIWSPWGTGRPAVLQVLTSPNLYTTNNGGSGLTYMMGWSSIMVRMVTWRP